MPLANVLSFNPINKTLTLEGNISRQALTSVVNLTAGKDLYVYGKTQITDYSYDGSNTTFTFDSNTTGQNVGDVLAARFIQDLNPLLSGGVWDVAVSNFPPFTGLTNTELRAVPVITSLASESGYLTYRNTALSNTPSTVKGSAGNVMGWNFININTVPVYVKFYNLVSGSVTVGTSAVTLTIMVPPSDGVTPGMFFLEPSLVPVEVFSTAISIACVTGLADNSTTAPTTPIHVNVRYK